MRCVDGRQKVSVWVFALGGARAPSQSVPRLKLNGRWSAGVCQYRVAIPSGGIAHSQVMGSQMEVWQGAVDARAAEREGQSYPD